MATPTQVSYWQEIRRSTPCRPTTSGAAAKTFSAMDQGHLADWVAGGIQADRDTLVRRLREVVERACACRPCRSAGRGALTGRCTPSSIGLRCLLSEAVLGVLALLAGIATR